MREERIPNEVEEQKILTLRLAVIEYYGDRATDAHVVALARRLGGRDEYISARQFIRAARRFARVMSEEVV